MTTIFKTVPIARIHSGVCRHRSLNQSKTLEDNNMGTMIITSANAAMARKHVIRNAHIDLIMPPSIFDMVR